MYKKTASLILSLCLFFTALTAYAGLCAQKTCCCSSGEQMLFDGGLGSKCKCNAGKPCTLSSHAKPPRESARIPAPTPLPEIVSAPKLALLKQAETELTPAFSFPPGKIQTTQSFAMGFLALRLIV